ncbi:MAG TPA: phospho-N-acetylmuramoyl-pentapeptide-transferase, partial [Actinomycetales bacterium]|nr:phospho-N-acetylmuramoyl-pentapeptide-transferase [Actinomycetales bacterium]
MKAVLAAAGIALLLSLLGTPLFIRFLVKRGYGQFIRDDGPTSHHTKRGTPTMGGAVIIGSTVAAYALAHLLTWSPATMSAVLVLGLMSGLGLV